MGDLHVLVDDHLVGNLRMRRQLVGAGAQDRLQQDFEPRQGPAGRSAPPRSPTSSCGRAATTPSTRVRRKAPSGLTSADGCFSTMSASTGSSGAARDLQGIERLDRRQPRRAPPLVVGDASIAGHHHEVLLAGRRAAAPPSSRFSSIIRRQACAASAPLFLPSTAARTLRLLLGLRRSGRRSRAAMPGSSVRSISARLTSRGRCGRSGRSRRG